MRWTGSDWQRWRRCRCCSNNGGSGCRSWCWSRWRLSATRLVDKSVQMICKFLEITHEYVVIVWVRYDISHDGFVYLNNNMKAYLEALCRLTHIRHHMDISDT